MQEIKLTFKGEVYTIPAKRAFEIGEIIEDIAPISEIAKWMTNPKFFKIAKCFGEMLRFAGVKVTNEEVHAEIMAQIKSGDAAQEGVLATQAVMALLSVLMDGMPQTNGADGKKADAS